MYRFRASAARRPAGLRLALLSSAAFLVASPCAFATDAVSIVRVEEDWKLVVSTPETASNSPQVTCTMSPAGSDESGYMTFELNHQSQPGYQTGGLHLHAWDDEYLVSSSHAVPLVCLDHGSETIRWTQSMTIAGELLVYEITQGSSHTWNDFGTGELRVAVTTALPNLNGYDPQASLSGSGVGFGANRVSSLALETVRLFMSTGEVVQVEVDTDVTQVD